MPPRLRTLVWREMPPCVRRMSLAWSRRFLYAELFLARIYLTCTKSPTWNFVGIAGTIGIALTILLFLMPIETEPDRSRRLARTLVSQSRPAWELDSRLLSMGSRKAPAYPVELLADDEYRFVRTERDTPRRRRTPVLVEDPPLLPLFVPEPEVRDVAVRDFEETESELDWFVREQPQPPKLGLDLEIVHSRRRSRHEPEVPDSVFTARTGSPRRDEEPDDPFGIETDDRWQVAHAVRDRRSRRRHDDEPIDHQTVAATLDPEPTGAAWQPSPIPETAPSVVDVRLDVSWGGGTSSRRRQAKQLQVRNLGSSAIEKIDVISGRLPDADELPGADWSSLNLLTHSVEHLDAGQEESVPLPRTPSRRGSRETLVSVLITTFVGGATRIDPAEVVRQRPRPVPRDFPRPARDPDRPHLTMTVGEPGRLPQDKMVSVPIRVVNDGNVTLYEVAILADIPPSLEHKYGRKVHYQLRKMAPGEERRATLLLTPLEAGAASVPLEVADGERRAKDQGAVNIQVADDELARAFPPEQPARRSADKSLRSESRRRNARSPATDF